jgi:hypothetical protein
VVRAAEGGSLGDYVIPSRAASCAPKRFGGGATARQWLLASFVRHREQVNMERHVFARSQRVFAIRKNFDLTKILPQQIAQTRPGEKILVIAFQQMPGDDLPPMKVWQDFHVWDREESAISDHAPDFAEENVRVLHVLDYFDADGAIPLSVGTR